MSPRLAAGPLPEPRGTTLPARLRQQLRVRRARRPPSARTPLHAPRHISRSISACSSAASIFSPASSLAARNSSARQLPDPPHQFHSPSERHLRDGEPHSRRPPCDSTTRFALVPAHVCPIRTPRKFHRRSSPALATRGIATAAAFCCRRTPAPPESRSSDTRPSTAPRPRPAGTSR